MIEYYEMIEKAADIDREFDKMKRGNVSGLSVDQIETEIKQERDRMYRSRGINFDKFSQSFHSRLFFLQRLSQKSRYNIPISKDVWDNISYDEEDIILHLLNRTEQQRDISMMKAMSFTPQIVMGATHGSR